MQCNYILYIGVGADLAGPVLAGPLFSDLRKFIFKNRAGASRTPITAGPLQRPFYAPALYECNALKQTQVTEVLPTMDPGLIGTVFF